LARRVRSSPSTTSYAVGFSLFDPADRGLHLPQFPRTGGNGRPIEQGFEGGRLPILRTIYRPPLPLEVTQEAHATTLAACRT